MKDKSEADNQNLKNEIQKLTKQLQESELAAKQAKREATDRESKLNDEIARLKQEI